MKMQVKIERAKGYPASICIGRTGVISIGVELSPVEAADIAQALLDATRDGVIAYAKTVELKG